MLRHSSIGLHYGIRKGKLMHVSQVPRGLSCGCVCPVCSEHLVAKQGQHREHHFAHAIGGLCRYARETALHLAAKEILERRKKIVLPAVKVEFSEHTEYYRETPVIAPEKLYQFDSIELECREGDIRPDVVVRLKSRKLYIEIRVTHEVDEHKKRRIQERRISTIEIDLSDKSYDLPLEELEKLVVEAGSHKKWIYNDVVARLRKRILSKATIRPQIYRGLAVHVDGCPLPARVWKGKPYANAIDDCTGCKHALAFVDESVICDG